MNVPFERRWTIKLIRRAARLWNAGKSASEVARAIGRTRNAVLGLSHRNRPLFQRKAEPRFRR
jgi:hypothetical protein